MRLLDHLEAWWPLRAKKAKGYEKKRKTRRRISRASRRRNLR